MLADAIAHYHDLLTDRLATDSQAHLDQQTRQRQFYFGERPICTVLRPRFLSNLQFRVLQTAVKELGKAFDRIYQAAKVDAMFRRQFMLTDAEEALLQIHPGYKGCSYPTARLDSFFVSEQELKFTEYNTETPAGAAYQDALTHIFYGLPLMQEFQRRYDLRPLPARPGVLHALLDSYCQWASNSSAPPRIAILDWREVPTYSEFRLFEDYFHSHGLGCRIIDPRELEYRDGKLWAGDYHITLIYKRVLISELLNRGGFEQPLIQALRDQAVCMVNSFGCKILYKKASLAALTDERNDKLFSPEQREAIARYIPWTRRLEERRTWYRGEPIDLVPFVLDNRDSLVLKPNDEYGGKGIVLGWTVDDSAWEKAVLAALTEPFVVQEKVNLPREVYPGYEGGKLRLIERVLDTNPYVCFGSYMSGCLTRISTEALVNVTAGGGSTAPTFVVEER
ncbi:MAG TPA: circularly permuted type 2 ATP-grasp protein [Gemmataceae bacterium]|nr:circularly permuted type 2 ATP-grasp protein [Gemmataceae bacterium]